MLASFPFVLLLGTVLGFLSGIGVGGGSLLMLWLTVVMELPQPEARSINLLFFIPSAVIACFFRWKQGILDPKTVLPAVIAGCLAAGLFSWLGMNLEETLLKKSFGILLIVTGLRELLYRSKKEDPRSG